MASMRCEPFSRMREPISARPECAPSQKLAISRTGLRAKLTVPLEPEDEEAAATSDTPESLALSAATRDRIQAALDELPPQYREVILLCDVEEMKYQEIAEVLAVPIGTVMSRLARGRTRMRQMLASERNAMGGK